MPYEHIPIAHIRDDRLRELFDRANQFLADVYSMLSGRQLKRTRGGACNLTATLALLCLLDALAKHVYPRRPKKNQGIRFRKLVVDRLHWGPESAGWIPKADAAEVLYDQLRNPLTHELGRDRRHAYRKPGFVEPTVGIWGEIRGRRHIAAVDARKHWPDGWPVLSVRTDAHGTRDKLTVAALYWVVKDLVRKLAATA